jgi:two-component system sensor histidine kinase VicK
VFKSPPAHSLAPKESLYQTDGQNHCLTLLAGDETTEVWTGAENITARSLDVLFRIGSKYDLCLDATGSAPILAIKEIHAAYVALYDRGVKIRILTEVTPDNAVIIKEISRFSEVRHLDGIIGNFTIADGTDYAGSPETENGILTKLIVSNVSSFVRLQQYFFETLWSKAVPASERIAELETGVYRQVTEVWRDPAIIASRSLEILSKMEKKYDFCTDWKGPSIIMSFDYIKKAYLDIVDRGCKLRLITEIRPDNIGYCKEIAKFAEVRHLGNIKGNFGIVDERIYGGIANTSERQEHTSYIHSTVREFVDQQQYFFETLWEKAKPARQRFREIEEGREPEKLELVPETEKSIALAFEVMRRTNKELLVLFATARTFALSVAAKPPYLYRAISEKGGTVRILVPRGEGTDSAIDRVLKIAPKTEIRITDADLSTRITIMISDRREFMSWELRDDSINDPYEAGGLATYSNNASLAESYATIFENLWRITEYAENLRVANLRLERNDQAMREFIDITAHELRNPIQPILGLSEILQEGQNSPEQKDLLEVIVRNARRLEQIAEDVLDVTRMESGKFRVVLERVDLVELVTAIVSDFQRSIEADHSKVRLLLLEEPGDNLNATLRLVTMADPNRIGQVLSNLLSNAIKFTSRGTIAVRLKRQANSDGRSEAVISVADTGSGIDPNIMPRLFEKFVSRSEKGIGLGLYLSKKIVEAHGGRIWASNNPDRVGATFHISLGLLD